MKIRLPEEKRTIDIVRCLTSTIFKQFVEQEFNKLFDEVGVDDRENITVDTCIVEHSGFISVTLRHDSDKIYEWITTNKLCAISEKRFCVTIHKDVYFVNHNNTRVYLSIFLKCAIPNEDMITLRMLGKVHEEIIPASVETSIFCSL